MNSSDLPTAFLSSFSRGKLKITCNDIPSINFTSTKDTMMIDVLDIPIKISGKPGLIKQLSEAKDLAKKYEVEYRECSAKEDSGVVDIFNQLAKNLAQTHG